MTSDDVRTGQCMCGAVTYRANVAKTISTCYCKMCQRWTAGAFMGVQTTEFEVTRGEDVLTVFESSDWATRAFCSTCGSSIYYFAPKFGGKAVALGTLDDTSGLDVAVQYFIDGKPEGFSLAESTKTLTTAEIEAAFSGSG